MRINKYIAASTGLGRRAVDTAVQEGRVTVNGRPAVVTDSVTDTDMLTLDGKPIRPAAHTLYTVLLNKPAGYVVSREGQGSKTIYDLLPAALHRLKPVGRLDKDSSGLLLLTNNGDLAHRLTHPSFQKIKIYDIVLDHPLAPLHRQMISDRGVLLDDGPSKFTLERIDDRDDAAWRVSMREGRNRQIRRTFNALGYTVVQLHRIQFGSHSLGSLGSGKWQRLP